MKFTAVLFFVCLLALGTKAQNDSLAVQKKYDTVHIGKKYIVVKHLGNNENAAVQEKNKKKDNINTEHLVLDLGFSNWADRTNYSDAASQGYIINRPGTPDIASKDFNLRVIKSVNIDIWFFMQRLNLINHYVNLKYGLGLDLNNYRFWTPLSFREGGTNPYNPSMNISHPFIFRDSISLEKDKLAADYLTIPLMLNFRTDPHQNKGLMISTGVSVGYLYSSRNKQISDEDSKHRNKGNYDLERWKFSYIAELGMGPLVLYGSYSPNSIFNNNVLDLKPYTIGIRFSSL